MIVPAQRLKLGEREEGQLPVYRDIHDGTTLVEHVLEPVPVVNIPVKDQNFLESVMFYCVLRSYADLGIDRRDRSTTRQEVKLTLLKRQKP